MFTRGAVSGDIYVMGAGGENPIPLATTPAFESQPVYSPDGQRIAYTRPLDSIPRIFVMDASGAGQVPLTSGPDPSNDPDWQALNPPACELGGPPKQTSFGVVTTTITCSEDVRVDASGQGKAPKAPKFATASKAKAFTLEPVSVDVPADQATTVTLTVPKTGRKALKKAAKAGKKGKATVDMTATDDLGESTQESLAVSFKKKK